MSVRGGLGTRHVDTLRSADDWEQQGAGKRGAAVCVCMIKRGVAAAVEEEEEEEEEEDEKDKVVAGFFPPLFPYIIHIYGYCIEGERED